MEQNLKLNLKNWNTGKGFSPMSKILKISEYKENHLAELIELFLDVVHSVNAADYTQEQLDMWAPEQVDTEKWRNRIENNFVVIVENENKIVGFGELSPEGCIDMLYVHKDYLRRGIGKELLDLMVEKARELNILEIFTEASITSKPFFESQGFKIVKKQVKTFNNVNFINYQMKKTII